MAACKEVYQAIGNAYEAEYSARRGNPDMIDARVFNAQTMNNSLYYGDHLVGRPAEDARHMRVTEIESALKYDKVSVAVAVEVIKERLGQLETLKSAFFRNA